MIWNSIFAMTVIDLLIIAATGLASWQFYQNRQLLKQLRATLPVLTMLAGLSIIALFYLADLCTMYLLPLWIPMKEAMATMRDLHLNLKWIVSVGGVGLIILGLFQLIRSQFPHLVHVQSQLTEKENYLDSILHSALDQAIIATDQRFIIRYYNHMAEQLFEMPRKKALGRSVVDIHAEEKVDPVRFEAGIRAVRETGEHRYSFQKNDGKTVRYLESRVSGIRDRDKRLIGYVLNTVEMTERQVIMHSLREALEEAEAANRAKSAFLATMSHEIRTPMNAILGMAEVLDGTDLNDEQRHYVQVFDKAGRTLLALINDILDLSKIEAGQIELEDVDFELGNTIDKVVQIFQGPAMDKGLTLTCRIDPETPRQLVGDELRLQQILFNLVSNAIKFTQQGEVRIEVRNSHRSGEEGSLLFSVTDTGIGVPTDKQKLIFSAFTQADVSTTRKFGGTGLGLAICNKLVGLMCGQLSLKSQPGKGSTFSFTTRFTVRRSVRDGPALPARQAEPGFWETDGQHARSAIRPLKILLVDDAEDNLLVLKAFLKKEPHDITIAENGQEALEFMMKSRFDLVFMDMQMPVMDGYAATRRFRQWEQENNREAVIIIALSAFAMKEDIKRVMEVGCDLHLSKPIRKQCLLDTISRCS